MGFALAEAFAMMGANVSLITGPTTLPTRHPSIVRTNIQTASELREACLKESPSADIIIMAAAVADYAPETFSARKIKKTKDTLILKLKPTRDILSEIAKKKRKDQILVGFALETEHERKNAMLKLQAKKLDYIVLNSLNDPGAGFGITTNKVTIFDKQGIIHEGTLKDKHEVALDIINAITRSSLPKKPS
jgi:phosphopantothenoylcysteine decarboxylase/phosphopantothenate--cysteine ligase